MHVCLIFNSDLLSVWVRFASFTRSKSLLNSIGVTFKEKNLGASLKETCCESEVLFTRSSFICLSIKIKF